MITSKLKQHSQIITWLAVEDVLPPDSVPVLIVIDSLVDVVWVGWLGCLHGEELWLTESGPVDRVTHWATLPVCPEAKESQEQEGTE